MSLFKSVSPRTRRRFFQWLPVGGSLVLAFVIYLAYRWAEPSPQALFSAHTLGGGNATIRLENSPLAGYVDGARSWSMHAGEVNLLVLPNASLGSIQSASIRQIKDGCLYDPPAHPVRGAGPTNTRVIEAGASDSQSGPVSARFHADEGRYSIGMLEAAPPDIEMLYTVKWQFRLTGNVSFRTQTDDEITAPSMTIYSLQHRRTNKQEQRVVCDQGGKMMHRGIQITAGIIRFSPKERLVECLSGVRGMFKHGNVQAERMYWSLDQEVLRCPESATGTILEMPFVFQGLTLDLKRGEYHASHISVQVNPLKVENLGQLKE